MSLNVGGNSQPANNSNQQGSDFGMGFLGFGNPTPPTSQPQNNGGLNLLGEDFLGFGGSPKQSQPVVNHFQP